MRDRLFSIIYKYNLHPNRDLGQNFLIVPDIVERNIERAEVSEKDIVLEIGPGLGVLTDPLSKRAGKVYAIEKDRRIVEILRKEYNWPNVEIIGGGRTQGRVAGVQQDGLKPSVPDILPGDV